MDYFDGLSCNVSVNSKPDHPPPERANSPSPGHKESAKFCPLGQINRAKTPPRGNYFLKCSKNPTEHKKEITKNSTEMVIYSEILKQ